MKRLIIALLFMFVGVTVYSQPQVFLNSSKKAVERYMLNESDWYLIPADDDVLSYYNKYTKVVVSYSFERFSGRFGYFCTGVVVDIDCYEDLSEALDRMREQVCDILEEIDTAYERSPALRYCGYIVIKITSVRSWCNFFINSSHNFKVKSSKKII